MLSSGISEPFQKSVNRAARRIRSANDFLIVAHIDADGISSAAIASETCRRLGKDYDLIFAKKMDKTTIQAINNSTMDLVWIVDLGSGYLTSYTRDNIVITDHHMPDPGWKNNQKNIDSFLTIEHVNLSDHGMNGSVDGCGASMTYLVSKAVNNYNIDLAYLSVIGACGDVQDRIRNKLSGINALTLKDAVDNGDVVVVKDLRFFGRETRPIIQYFQYSGEIEIPGITNNNTACNELMANHNIPLKIDGKLTVWNDLTSEQKNNVIKDVLKLIDPKDVDAAYNDVYTLPRFPKDGGLRDAKEFATLLNSCGKYDDASIGVRICFGDKFAIKKAKNNRSDHKKSISDALQLIKQNDLIRVKKYIQYFDSGNLVKDTVIGTVSGMILNTPGFKKDMPMIAFADSDDGIKVSARASRRLGEMGLDLSVIMFEASNAVGGYGGGHNVAAGATIPTNKKEEFLDIVENMVCSQLLK